MQFQVQGRGPGREALDDALALGALAGELAGTANGFGALPGFLLGRLFVMVPGLHFPEQAFALHLLLQRAQGLLDIIVAYDDLYDVTLSCCSLRLVATGTPGPIGRMPMTSTP